MPSDRSSQIPALHNLATQLRIDSIQATTAAGSGHPTSSMSAAEIMACLFFSVMRLDPANPRNPENDRFILSKGHAAPVLYSVWAELGLFSREHLLTLRKLDSNLEGHPTPILPFVAVPTGSLGQGLSVGLGMALNARVDGSPYRTYVLMGDGEIAEGSVWEAAEVASHDKVDNLCAIVDVNRLGQSQPTMLQHDLETYQKRWAAFGWNALVVDGHDVSALLDAFEKAAQTKGQPTVILARTFKGKGVSFLEDKENWHGKALKPAEAENALKELQAQFTKSDLKLRPQAPAARTAAASGSVTAPKPNYDSTKQVATREAFGEALAAIGQVDKHVVAIDGDVKNSTYTDHFEKADKSRFFEGYIAEQNMVGMSMGLAACGKAAFAATFACFFTRAADFIRLAGLAHSNIKLVGTHAGVSIGEDGSSQMGLEDLSLFRSMAHSVVLYPSDAVSTWNAVTLAAETPGLFYIRTGRPKNNVIYKNDEAFALGKAKVLRQSPQDVITVVAAGVTLHEALKAHEQLKQQGVNIRVIDLFSVRPIDSETLLAAAKATGNSIITVEDHYLAGGIGDAVCEAVAPAGVRVHRMGVTEIPHSGTPEELLHKYRIDAAAIVEQVHALAPVTAK